MKFGMKDNVIRFLSVVLIAQLIAMISGGCAQISAPTGGPKDTTAPKLVKALPELNKINFTENKITLTFNEFIELQDLQSNLLVSPLQKINPSINSNLRTITIKLKDTLNPNTTYSINFGNAIKDINEGNVLKDFSYIFSTGNSIDSLELTGKVLLAQNGKVDSTILVLLYRNATDTAINSKKPDYISRLKGDGSFTFKYLPSDNFRIYALKDGDGNKWYNTKTETFAFYDEIINTGQKKLPINLFAYAEKIESPTSHSVEKKLAEKKLKFTNNLSSGKQDLLEPFEIIFKTALKNINLDSIVICDTNYKKLTTAQFKIDSSRKKISISEKWQPNMMIKLIIFKGAFEDSSGLTLLVNDTINFLTKNTTDYGSLKLTFKNIDLSRHPILEFMEGESIKWRFPVEANEWNVKMILPGEYDVQLLYDENSNGKWDPGDFSKKLQPERATTLPQKISIKADWENEREIDLK